MNIKYLSIAATLAGLGAASSFAEIRLTDNLSTSGFLDMSAAGGMKDDIDLDTLVAGFDQFELDFMFKFGDKVSARADISQGGAGGGAGAIHLEQGFVTAHLGSLSISTGRFLSSSGFEAAEPTGLYQYSTSLNLSLPLGLGTPWGGVYGGYQNGVNLAYSTPMFGLYGAVVTDLWETGETDLKTPGFEGQVSVTPIPGLTAKVAYLFQMYDEDATVEEDASQQLLNAWASYAFGPLTVAGEYNLLLDWDVSDETGNGYLVMANYKFTDMFAATLRHSGMFYADLDPFYEFTVSPSVAISANWLVLAEFRYDMLPEPTDDPLFSYAVESLFSF